MNHHEKKKISIKKPPWLRRRLPTGPAYEQVRSLIKEGRLHTVCQEAQCPNQFECFSGGIATFLIMGPTCTRHCRFCSIGSGTPPDIDPEEPMRVARAAYRLDLKYVVITSVTRDDLDDGGASHFAATIGCIKEKLPRADLEVLIPDFQGDEQALKTVLEAGPSVLNHNLETVPRLYERVRPQADYQRSLDLLERCAHLSPSTPLKSGLMLGLGETAAEVRRTLHDLYASHCRLLTLGQYLQPSKAHLPVARFIPPEEFEMLGREAVRIGFKEVASGPFVRSSYHAKGMYTGMVKKT